MKTKKEERLRRAARARRRIRSLSVPRLCIHRTPRHIYAQLTTSDGTKVLASASSLDKEIRSKKDVGTGVKIASVVGEAIAKRVIAIGIKKAAFDRSGYKYHGRVKALADSAREGGLDF